MTLEKPILGFAGSGGGMLRAYGAGSTQAAAEAQALAGLNGQRKLRYDQNAGTTADRD